VQFADAAVAFLEQSELLGRTIFEIIFYLLLHFVGLVSVLGYLDQCILKLNFLGLLERVVHPDEAALGRLVLDYFYPERVLLFIHDVFLGLRVNAEHLLGGLAVPVAAEGVFEFL
jgi:hypothetical protein